MYFLPGNPFSQAVEAYRDSGEALCSKGMHAVPPPFTARHSGRGGGVGGSLRNSAVLLRRERRVPGREYCTPTRGAYMCVV